MGKLQNLQKNCKILWGELNPGLSGGSSVSKPVDHQNFHTSRGNFTTPGVSTLPKIFTLINCGEIPDTIDFGIWLGIDLLNLGKKRVSPSNIRISLVWSP